MAVRRRQRKNPWKAYDGKTPKERLQVYTREHILSAVELLAQLAYDTGNIVLHASLIGVIDFTNARIRYDSEINRLEDVDTVPRNLAVQESLREAILDELAGKLFERVALTRRPYEPSYERKRAKAAEDSG